MRQYSVRLAPDPEGGFTVRVPALPGLNTEGDTVQEALANAREAIDLYLDVLKERGESLPEEKDNGQPPFVTIET